MKRARGPKPTWGVFLDRDGTLLRLVPYLSRPEQARLYDGVGEALRTLQESGAALVVVTNQSGIGRGWFTRRDVDRVNGRLRELLARHGVTLDAIETCPHAPPPDDHCDCRKPGPGMILRAAKRLGLDLARSWTIGDNESDLGAARRSGTHSALVLTGYGRATRRTRAGKGAELVGGTLRAVARAIVEGDRPPSRRRGQRPVAVRGGRLR